MPDVFGCTCDQLVCVLLSFCSTRERGCNGARHSLRPPIFEGIRARLGQITSRERECSSQRTLVPHWVCSRQRVQLRRERSRQCRQRRGTPASFIEGEYWSRWARSLRPFFSRLCRLVRDRMACQTHSRETAAFRASIVGRGQFLDQVSYCGKRRWSRRWASRMPARS